MIPTAKPDTNAIAAAVRALLHAAGLDPADPELTETPQRVAHLWGEIFLSGYASDEAALLADAIPAGDDGGTVFAFNLAVHGLCPHHLLPFQGRAHVAYVPHGRIIGIGRLAELAACHTQRLTLQEHACKAIAAALTTHLGASAAACVIEARHACLGVPYQQHASNLVLTTATAGDRARGLELESTLLKHRSAIAPHSAP